MTINLDDEVDKKSEKHHKVDILKECIRKRFLINGESKFEEKEPRKGVTIENPIIAVLQRQLTTKQT